MKFHIEVGEGERHKVYYSRNWFFGGESIVVNGRKIRSNNVLDPRTHFSINLVKRIQFELGTAEKNKVIIEKKRPLLFAGFRPHTYRVYANDKLLLEKCGY